MEKINKTPKAKNESVDTAVKSTRAKIESYDISKSDETMALAVDLARFIKENKLYQNVQGKEYVNVEGWQYAGSRLGILPVIETLTDISTDTEMKYQAKVNLLDMRSQLVVGAGFAICSNKEQGKKYYQEFAIASMAQTRAIGKAYRNILAWIIRAAGYEPTPAEEMDYGGNAPEVKTTQPAPAPAKSEQKPAQAQAPAEAATEPQIKYASAKQKEEIIRLLNNSVITRQEKTKMLLNINKLDEERAAQSITKLKKVIEDRENEDSSSLDPDRESAAKELYDLATRNCEILGEAKVKELYGLCNTGSVALLKKAKEKVAETLAEAENAAA